MKTKLIAIALAVCASSAALIATSQAGPPDRAVVYVRSQGLFYDTVVPTSLPPKGRFQLLEMGDNGLETEYGPGDRGYVGGRWMADFDGDGEFDHFECPLLGPGRESP